MELDRLLPTYDISDTVAVTVASEPSGTWEALMEADLLELGRDHPLVGAMGGLRIVPELVIGLLHGRRPEPPPPTLRLRDTTQGASGTGAWIPLGEEEGAWIALGLVGRFWKPVIEYAAVAPEEFTAFAEPGWAKTVYFLAVEPIAGGRTLVTGSMRTATTDDRARRWFRRYWTLGVGSGAHVLVNALLESVRDAAEARVPA